MKKLSALVLLILITFSGYTQSTDIDYPQTLKAGFASYENNQIQESRQAFLKIINAYRQSSITFSKDLYLTGGVSEEEFEKFSDKALYASRAYMYLAGIELSSNNPYEAITLFSMSLEIDSTSVPTIAGLGDC